MSTTVVVLLVSLLAGAVLVALGRLHGTKRHPDDVIDPNATEHWLLERVKDHPRLRRVLSTMDQRVIGGAAVAVSFVVLFAAALIVGAVFDTVDTTRGFARWDQSVSQWGPDHATTAAAEFLRQVTNLGASGYLLILMTVIGIVDWFRRRDLSSLLFLLTVGFGVLLINNGLKLLIMRERPPGAALLHPSGSSFPSGHSAAAAACWLAIALGGRPLGAPEVPAVHLGRRSRYRLHGRHEQGSARCALAHRRDRRRVRRLGVVRDRRHRLRWPKPGARPTRRAGRQTGNGAAHARA